MDNNKNEDNIILTLFFYDLLVILTLTFNAKKMIK